MRRLFDGSRRELTFVSTAAVLLVLLRCSVATLYEGFYFDSDQAIVGLMAKHLSTLRAFPLYYYGQNYMLGVQAWLIAPFFALWHPSVTVMRLPLVLLNIVVAVWIVRGLAASLSLRPALAFVAALPFIIPTPATATHLLETGGASIEPLVYVLVLWAVRRRPLTFGVLLAVGFQHREWTIFAAPALVLAELATGELWTRGNLRRAAWMAAGFALAWLVLDDLKMHLTAATAALQVVQLRSSLCFDADWQQRVMALVHQALPPLYGATHIRPFSLGMNTPVATGHAWVGWMIGVTLAIAIIRTAWTWRHSSTQRPPGAGFPVYLGCLGAFAICAYPLSCTIVLNGVPLLRYLLFGLFLPVGAGAAFFRFEPSRVLKQVVAAVFVIWAGANLLDTSRVVVAAVRTPPGDEHRVLADYLVANHIHYARASYWDAYVVDFLSQERVIVASFDTFRIPEYQKEVDAHSDVAIRVVRRPCDGFAVVASWCLQR